MWDCPEPEVWGEEWVTPELRRGMGGGQRKPCSVRSVPTGNVLGGATARKLRGLGGRPGGGILRTALTLLVQS